jgi:Doubled CXXCH motif (Paired_CXXCH_1)
MRCLSIGMFSLALVVGTLLDGCAPRPGGPAPTFTDPTPAQHADHFFPIASGIHAVDCEQCHGSTDTFAQVDCSGCHPQAATEPKHVSVGGFQWLATGTETSALCLRCHADAQVNRLLDHLPWVITPPGTDPGHKHYLASCLVCHPSARADKPFGRDFTHRDCSSCHPQATVDATHVGKPGYSYATVVCLTCHANGGIN